MLCVFLAVITDVLRESLHKRLAYLRGDNIIKLADYARRENVPANAQLNAAKRQTIPAFRERGIWMIGTPASESRNEDG